MDRQLNTFDGIIKRIFGEAGRIDGCVGTATRRGEIRILLDDRVIGCGRDFEAALRHAQRTVARQAAAA